MNYHYGREEHVEDKGSEYWERYTAAEWQHLVSQAAALNVRIWQRSWKGESARLERLYERGYSRYCRRLNAMRLELEAETYTEYHEDRAEAPEEYPF